MRLALATALLGTLGSFAAPAAALGAPSLTRGSGFGVFTITYTASSGDDDQLSVTRTADGDTTFDPFNGTDADVAWAALPGDCNQDASTRVVTCTGTVARIVFDLRDEDDRVSAAGLTTPVTFDGGPGDDSLTAGSGNDVAEGGDGDDDLDGADGADTLRGGAGSDTLSGGGADDLLEGGDGVDSLIAGDGDDTLRGQGAADALDGGAGDDMLDGGAGRDTLLPGPGSDAVVGGEGFDEVRYTDRAAGSPGVAVTLDDMANDGESGEGDNVHADVEDAAGGGGPDRLVGNGAANFLSGGDGDDVIDGGGGFDVLSGGDGADTLRARDGNGERVDCGSGADAAVGDQIDRLVGCEAADLSADLVADADGDGSSKPADCNDTNPAIRPGAPEAPDNAIDENCDGVDSTDPDRDRDGAPRPLDCDDGNAAVHPGAREIPGNRTDEDCDGLANPFPSISSTVRTQFSVFGGITRLTELTALSVPTGSRVAVRCRGRGCSKKLRRGYHRTLRRSARRVRLTGHVRRLRLRPGARLEVSITRRGTLGAVITIRTRARKLPSTSRRCLPPGAKRSVEC